MSLDLQPVLEPDTFLPRVLPAGLRLLQRGDDGASYEAIDGLRVIVSAATEQDGRRWLHLSASRAGKLPTWEDLKWVKRVFVGPNRQAIQVLPRDKDYVNLHPHVLHLWACLDGDVLPDFTQGTGSL